MKRCPYCAEEIKEEAIKCKHCNEWINNPSNTSVIEDAKDLFGKAQNFVKNKKEELREKRYKHIHVPNSDNPIQIKETTFYDSFLEDSKTRFDYNKIISIYFWAKRKSANYIINDDELELCIYFDNGSQNFPLEQREKNNTIRISLSSFIGIGSSKKDKERVIFIYEFLKKNTFEQRFRTYVNHIVRKGFFYYPNGFKIYNNGDIEKSNEYRTNIVESYKHELLQYGSSFSAQRIKTSNPYLLIIGHPEDKNAWFSSSTHINVNYDRDLVNEFLTRLIKKGSIIDY